MKAKDLKIISLKIKSGQVSEAICELQAQSLNERGYHLLGKAFTLQKKWPLAVGAYEQAIKLEDSLKPNLSSRRRLIECQLKLQNFNQALEIARQTKHLTDINTEGDCTRLGMTLAGAGLHEQIPSEIAIFAQKWLSENKDDLPNGQIILVAALPKSASTSLTNALAKASNYRYLEFVCYPNNYKGLPISNLGSMSYPALKILKGKGSVIHSHIDPSSENLEFLSKEPWLKTVCHIRNPLDSLTSATDMLVRTHAKWLLARNPKIFDRPISEIIDWMIMNYLPYQINWIKGWVNAYDQKHKSIISFTTYNELVQTGHDEIAQNICKKLDVPNYKKVTTNPRRTGIRVLPPSKELLSEKQVQQILSAIPLSLRERFGW